MQKATLSERKSFITADGSSIRELAVPVVLLCCCAHAYSHDVTVMTGG